MNVENFRAALTGWFERGHRDLPWRQTRDPYRIWVSEIMLQQTRAAAAIPYYQAFLTRYPDFEALARAPEAEVLASWSGLGYYSRARNMRKAAGRMAEAGEFPRTHEAIRALPGVGTYTAAAVASIAYGLPHAVLDGNVLRVISRLAADAGDIGSAGTRARFQKLADTWLDGERPGAFNQAMMELGAIVCLPRNPQCLLCPVAEFCVARKAGTQNQFPVKLRKDNKYEAAEDLLCVERAGSLLLRQRSRTESRMADFWELPQVHEVPVKQPPAELGTFHHTVVQTRYTVRVYSAQSRTSKPPAGMEWIAAEKRETLPLTTVTRKALALRRSAT